MRGLLPVLVAGSVLAGCSTQRPPDGGVLLLQMYEREQAGCFRVLESTEIVGSGQPFATVSRRLQHGHHQVIVPADGTGGDGLTRVQNGQRTFHYLPEERRLEWGTIPKTPMDRDARLSLIRSNYEARTLFPDNVSGRPAYVVELFSVYPGRPRYRFWVDRQTGHRLRMESWSPDGRLQSITQALEPPQDCQPDEMKSAMPPPGDPSVQSVAREEPKKMDEAALRSVVGFPLARATYIPRGFHTLGSFLFTCTEGLGNCARWDMTDGVVTVSVIQSSADIGNTSSLKMPDDVRGPMVMARKQGFQFVVQGNLSRAELKRIVGGIVVP